VPALRIEGYVIVSADGMLANGRNVMPDELKFEGDKAFFTAALDRADLILHGRNSYEDQPNSPQRKRVILTRKVEATEPDPSNPKSTLWNPAGASFEAACDHAGVHAGSVGTSGARYLRPGVHRTSICRSRVVPWRSPFVTRRSPWLRRWPPVGRSRCLRR